MRLRLRTGIVLVALVALLMAMVRRREYCLERVRYHHSVAGRAPAGHGMYAAMFLGTRAVMFEHASWHNKNADRLTYAAAHPWLPIPTEPPEPPTFVRPSPGLLRFLRQLERSAATD
jgi:hypothetical protein